MNTYTEKLQTENTLIHSLKEDTRIFALISILSYLRISQYKEREEEEDEKGGRREMGGEGEEEEEDFACFLQV